MRDSLLVLLVLFSVVLAGSAALLRADEGSPAAPAAPPPVRVLVVHPDGAPVPGAQVALGRRGRPATTDAEGRAVLTPEHPGRYLAVVVETPDVRHGWLHRHLESTSVPVEVGYREVAPAEVRLVVPRGGSLRVLLDRKDAPYEEPRSRVEVSLRRYYPDGTLWSPHDGDYREVERLDPEGGRTRLTFTDLPAGRYRLTTSAPDRTRTSRTVEVRPGAPTEIATALGDPAPPVTFRYRGPFGERGTQRFNVNPLALGEGSADLAHGTFAEGEPAFRTRALRPGPYALFLWDLNLAMWVEVPEEGERVVDVHVPEALVAPTGDRMLTVLLFSDGVPFRGLPILLAPVRADPLAPGRWFRFSHGPRDFFERLGPGTYDVLVLDGGWGGRMNLAPNPLVRRVSIASEDVDLRIDL